MKKKPLKISKEVKEQLADIGIDMLDQYQEISDSSCYCLYCKDLQLSAFPIPERPWLYHCYACGLHFVEQ